MTDITMSELQKMKNNDEKIVCLTAYDATQSLLASSHGAEVLLIGDSLGMVVQGNKTTIPVTMPHMVYHTQCVQKLNQGSLLIADMPFMSYDSIDNALKHAKALMQAGANMVKPECGLWTVDIIRALTQQGIPTCAHIGFTPQSISLWGKPKVYGHLEAEQVQLIELASKLQDAGAHLILLECVPPQLAKTITQNLSVPTIGIGAGPDTDGQILVFYDMIGATSNMKPRFIKNFMTSKTPSIQEAISQYASDVKSGEYPKPEHCYL